MTKEEFVRFEELVRTRHVYWCDSEGFIPEVLRVELFENGEHGTWVKTYAKDCDGSCALKDYKASDFKILEPIALSDTSNTLLRELEHLVRLIEPLEAEGTLDIPGLATLNGARAAIAKAKAP